MTTVKNDKEVFTKYDFADIMKGIRFLHHSTQKEFAEMLGIKKSYLSMIELGERIPDAIVIRQIADRLGCTTDFLLGKEEAPSHDASFACEWTGLSSGSVEILHKAVENDMINGYRLFIDLFEYMLNQNKMYWYEHNGKIIRYRTANNTSWLMNYLDSALNAHYLALAWDQQQFEYSENDADIIISKIMKAREFLESVGETTLDSRAAKEFYLRKASDLFKDTLSSFIDVKIEENPEYYKQLFNSVIFNQELIDSREKHRSQRTSTEVSSSEGKHIIDEKEETPCQ